MSLITRCPTCETMFRVVPDQLRVSEGWVRCGQCAEVFDATQNMVAPAGAPAGGAVPAPPQAPTASTPKPVTAASATVSTLSATVASSAPPDLPTTAAQADAPLAPADVDPEPQWADASPTDPQTAILPSDGAEPLGIDPREAVFASRPAFLQDEPSPSIWRRPIVRLALAVVLAVLLALLAMQFLIKERDRVAAMHPAMRPVLEAVCVMADCSIGPLRQIESIVIDSSSFSRVRGDDYRLGFSLKNTAPIEIAMPAIELSLTDPQDQPVIRRVLLPTEFGARSAALAGAGIWTGSLALTVQPDIGAQRITGYRLLAFYP